MISAYSFQVQEDIKNGDNEAGEAADQVDGIEKPVIEACLGTTSKKL